MHMQIYADVTGRGTVVAGAEQVSALRVAMLGAVAAGQPDGGYDSLAEAAARMALPPAKLYRPTLEHLASYNTLYAEYRRLYDCFSRGKNEMMKVLRRLWREWMFR